MIHFVLHEAKDTVAVAVVEGIKAGATLTACPRAQHQDQAVVSQLLMLGTGSQFPWARLMHWPSKQTMYSFRITQ